jgi:hypothetical protein
MGPAAAASCSETVVKLRKMRRDGHPFRISLRETFAPPLNHGKKHPRECAGLPLIGRNSKLLGVQVLRHYQQKSWVLLTYCRRSGVSTCRR